MSAVLEELEHRHGSVRDYLLASGSDADELDAIRRRLRG
jgi:hypothetical protein